LTISSRLRFAQLWFSHHPAFGSPGICFADSPAGGGIQQKPVTPFGRSRVFYILLLSSISFSITFKIYHRAIVVRRWAMFWSTHHSASAFGTPENWLRRFCLGEAYNKNPSLPAVANGFIFLHPRAQASLALGRTRISFADSPVGGGLQ
jgi:hypothetical protein